MFKQLDVAGHAGSGVEPSLLGDEPQVVYETFDDPSRSVARSDVEERKVPFVEGTEPQVFAFAGSDGFDERFLLGVVDLMLWAVSIE